MCAQTDRSAATEL